MAMMSWIIEGLANIMSSQDRSTQCLTYHKTVFPAPATRKRSVSKKGEDRVTTNAFHGSIEENPDRTLSMPRTCCPERTIPPSRCVVIHRRCYGFSKDREVTATFKHLSATCRLPDNLSN